MTGEKFTEVLKRIDAANAADPQIAMDGEVPHPAALLYGRRMSAEGRAFAARLDLPAELAPALEA